MGVLVLVYCRTGVDNKSTIEPCNDSVMQNHLLGAIRALINSVYKRRATVATYSIVETQYPGMQTEPVGFFGNDFGGDINRPVLKDFKVIGYMGSTVWLESKTGDSSDSIQINFTVDPRTFDRVLLNKIATFKGNLNPSGVNQAWVYEWSCTAVSGNFSFKI